MATTVTLNWKKIFDTRLDSFPDCYQSCTLNEVKITLGMQYAIILRVTSTVFEVQSHVRK